MYCTGCGKEIKDGSRFCIHCGKEQTPVAQNTAYGNNYAAPKKKAPVALIIGIVCAVLMIAVFIVAAFKVSGIIKDKLSGENAVQGTDSPSAYGNDGDEDEYPLDADDNGGPYIEELDGEGSVAYADNYYEIMSEALEEYDNETECFRDSAVVYATKGSESYIVGDPDYSGFANVKVGSRIADYDGDEQPELLQVQVRSDGSIALIMCEYEYGNVAEHAWIGMDDPIVYMPGYEDGALDIFSIGNTIYTEQSEYAHLLGDGVLLSLSEYTYDGENFIAGKSAYYAGSDGEYSAEYMDDIASMGVDGADWNDLFDLKKRTHDYMGDIDNICEFVGQDCTTSSAVSDWLSSTSEESLPVIRVSVGDVTFGKISVESVSDETEETKAEDNGDFIFPDSDSRYLDMSDLEKLDSETSRIAINELYARHGYVFTTEEMQNYFNSLEWYRDMPKDPDFDGDTEFNIYEYTNKELLVEYSTNKGWR